MHDVDGEEETSHTASASSFRCEPPLHCPACRGRYSNTDSFNDAVSVALNDQGVCPRCGTAWPIVSAWGRSIAVVHGDPVIAATLRSTIDVLERARSAAATTQPDAAPSDVAHDELFSSWSKSLWTWGPAHLGQHLTPPVAQPDTGWVTAFLQSLEDLPAGPVLLLGGAVAGETLALPPSWTDGGPNSRAVVCLESHPWLLAGAALATAPDAQLGVLRRPSVLSWRPLNLPKDGRARLERTTLVLGDAHDPPFSAGSFAVIIALNVVDSVRDPWLVMQQCEGLLKTDGALLISSPWHFQPEITMDSARLDRGLPADADLPWLIAGRLTGAALPGVLDGLALQHLERDLPWRVRMHDRLTWEYAIDAMLLRRVNSLD